MNTDVDLRAELEKRRDFVARLEQERADVQNEVDAFRLEYNRRVGDLQADLDVLDLHVAEYKLRNELVRLRGNSLDAHKLEAEVEWRLRDRREQFAGYRESVRQAQRAPLPNAIDAASGSELRSVYRDLAKRIHPDLTTDPADRVERDRLMADINAAYARSDLPSLKAISARLAGAAGAVRCSEDAEWLRAEIARLDLLIIDIRSSIAEMNRSDWLAMKLDSVLARSRGLDWFASARRTLEARIPERRAELEALIAEFRELVRTAGLA